MKWFFSSMAPTVAKVPSLFVMFANNHHKDGHVAVWLPTLPGVQASLIAASPDTYFRLPSVGVKGWDGIELDRVGEEELRTSLRIGRRLHRRAW
jgi:hypothetical protein